MTPAPKGLINIFGLHLLSFICLPCFPPNKSTDDLYLHLGIELVLKLGHPFPDSSQIPFAVS